jgi:secreted trypsin-like serine protease
MQNAIAVLKLQTAVTFTHFIVPACLNLDSSLTTEGLVAVGIGQASFDDRQIPHSNWLLKNHVSEVTIDDCRRIYTTRLKLTEAHMCAQDTVTHNDLCDGSSGGPLGRIVNGKFYLFGVKSLGSGCGTPTPDVYVRVSKYIEWIESVVWE